MKRHISRQLAAVALGTCLAFTPVSAGSQKSDPQEMIQSLKNHPKLKRFMGGLADSLYEISCEIRYTEFGDFEEHLDTVEASLKGLHWTLMKSAHKIKDLRAHVLKSLKKLRSYIDSGAVDLLEDEREELADYLEALAIYIVEA